jgi:hypothetical protein
MMTRLVPSITTLILQKNLIPDIPSTKTCLLSDLMKFMAFEHIFEEKIDGKVESMSHETKKS